MSDEDKPIECEACSYDEVQLFKVGPRWLCFLCYSTLTETYTRNLTAANFDTAVLLKTICFVGNVIIHQLRSESS